MSASWRLLAVVIVVALPGRLRADDPQEGDRTAIFKTLDANHDGQITDNEVTDGQRQLFKRLLRTSDRDGDGKLSEAEFLAGLTEDRPPPPAEKAEGAAAGFLQAPPAQVFKRLDANSDGKIELGELPEQLRPRLERFLNRFDSDGDKALSLDEFEKGRQTLRAQSGAEKASGTPAMALMRVLDRDGNGTLDRDEIARASKALQALDRNGDGTLDREELSAAETPTGDTSAPRPNQLLKRLTARDKDGDGKWSAGELPPALRGAFDKLDANGDGFVDADEVKQSAAMIRSLLPAGQGQKKTKKKDAA
jgi:Ca2+-binding EF-hand superfamily protein